MRWRTRPGPVLPIGNSSPSFEAVVLPHLDTAYGLARWLVRDPHLAEDVVQDAVVKALTYFATFRGGDGRSWFLRVVRNEAYSALAVRRRSTPGTGDLSCADHDALLTTPDPGADAEASLSQRQEAARLRQAVANLPDDLRECLVLKELEELSYKEISQVAGVPIGTVMSRLWRARRALIRELGEGSDHGR